MGGLQELGNHSQITSTDKFPWGSETLHMASEGFGRCITVTFQQRPMNIPGLVFEVGKIKKVQFNPPTTK